MKQYTAFTLTRSMLLVIKWNWVVFVWHTSCSHLSSLYSPETIGTHILLFQFKAYWFYHFMYSTLPHTSKMENMAQIENSHVYQMFLVNREI